MGAGSGMLGAKWGSFWVRKGQNRGGRAFTCSGIYMQLVRLPLPFCHHYTPWFCTGRIADAGLRGPIGKAEAFLRARGQKFSYPKEISANTVAATFG